MNAAKGMIAAIVWVVWISGALAIQYMCRWQGLAIYLVGSVLYAVWCRLLERSMK